LHELGFSHSIDEDAMAQPHGGRIEMPSIASSVPRWCIEFITSIRQISRKYDFISSLFSYFGIETTKYKLDDGDIKAPGSLSTSSHLCETSDACGTTGLFFEA
jgi:hypothetical protein